MKSPPGGGMLRLAEAGQQRPGEQERGADLVRELLVDGDVGDAGGAEAQAVVGDPGDLDAEPLEQRDLRLGVADPRHPVQQQLLLGEQAGGEDRQGRVLVAGDGHLARERRASFDDELLHGPVRVLRAMRRGWKIADRGRRRCSRVLLAINALVVDAETKSAEVTVPGGRILSLPGGDVQVLDVGPRGGSPIVLIHCYTCAIDWWDGMMPLLARDHRVVAIDLLGFGGSEKPASGYSMPDQAALVAEALTGSACATRRSSATRWAGPVGRPDRSPAAVNRMVDHRPGPEND